MVEFIVSPNCDDRPDVNDISLIVIHGISLPPGEYGGDGVNQLFTNTLDPDEHPYYRELHQLRVSSHLFIRRNGTCIQYVPFHQRAWHAGISSYRGRTHCNDFSIGIELEGVDNLPYEEIQYKRLNDVLAALRSTYDIAANCIAGHSDIAPGRKTDPGEAFDWNQVNHV